MSPTLTCLKGTFGPFPTRSKIHHQVNAAPYPERVYTRSTCTRGVSDCAGRTRTGLRLHMQDHKHTFHSHAQTPISLVCVCFCWGCGRIVVSCCARRPRQPSGPAHQAHIHSLTENMPIELHPRQTPVHVVTAEWKLSNQGAYQQLLSASDPSGNNLTCSGRKNVIKNPKMRLLLCQSPASFQGSTSLSCLSLIRNIISTSWNNRHFLPRKKPRVKRKSPR